MLIANRNRINSVEFPEGFEKLVELDLQDNVFESIPYLEKQKQLRYIIIIIFHCHNSNRLLNLSYNRILKIDNLPSNTDLQELLLASNNIKKIEGIENLKNLKNLELGFNKIEVNNFNTAFLFVQSIESVDHLVFLEKLWLGKNRIKEITNINTLKNLRILSLQVNNFSSIC